MERANIFRQIVFKFLLDMAHHLHDFLGTFSEAQRRRSGNQPFSAPHEKFRVKFVSKVMELETDGARGQVNLFRSAGHAGGVHDREEQFELVNIHLLLPLAPATHAGGLAPESSILFFASARGRTAFYTADKCLRQVPLSCTLATL